MPTFTVPADGSSTVNCIADAQNVPTAPTVTDACGNTLTPVMTEGADPTCEGTKVYTFVDTNSAGNTDTWLFTYTIEMPTFTAPADGSSTVNCIADAQNVPTAPTVTDACGNTLTPVMTEGADPTCEGTKVYTFVYTDCAGNSATWLFTYTIEMPTFTAPADGSSTVNCIADAQTVPTAPTVTDACGYTFTPVMTARTAPPFPYTKLFPFVYTDCAGNTDTWLFT